MTAASFLSGICDRSAKGSGGRWEPEFACADFRKLFSAENQIWRLVLTRGETRVQGSDSEATLRR